MPARVERLPEEAVQAVEQRLELRVRMLVDVVREASPQLIVESTNECKFKVQFLLVKRQLRIIVIGGPCGAPGVLALAKKNILPPVLWGAVAPQI